MVPAMRDFLVFYLNGERIQVSGKEAFLSLSDFLRYRLQKTGTKVVCAEGDCGACTVLFSRLSKDRMSPFLSMNSCIAFLFQMDGCHIVTVEGLASKDRLHCAQQSMIENFGAQCGFCTPGFIGSMAYLTERAKIEGFSVDEKKARNYLTGNLCRCTGYKPILDACVKMQTSQEETLASRYLDAASLADLRALRPRSVTIADGGRTLHLPATSSEARELRAKNPSLRLVSGATDLGVLINKSKYDWSAVMSLQNIDELAEIHDRGDHVWIGARANLEQVEARLTPIFPEFGRLLHIFASPQIKNSATLIGNLMNASPIGDTTPFLMAADARLAVEGPSGRRLIVLRDLYTGYKKLSVLPEELVTGVEIPKTKDSVCLYKTSVRKDLDISAVTFACCYQLQDGKISSLRLAVGGVGPMVIRLPEIEKFLKGREWSESNFQQARDLLLKNISPIGDVRGSREYRLRVAGNLLMKMYFERGREAGLVASSEVPPWR
jgi:xanthine dehydrogenase small subunit